ncbi:hypothetical protein [Stenoxybacter acetivorans]|uniref:hypothetical protein n=1 Tax=Stenoxybacter acetivorans TaxID=422441 RepID=UPI000568215C|nr:hypothetical protein [Stenoxybacter acetivorans]
MNRIIVTMIVFSFLILCMDSIPHYYPINKFSLSWSLICLGVSISMVYFFVRQTKKYLGEQRKKDEEAEEKINEQIRLFKQYLK